jgi:hypothetical protein
MKTFAKEFLDSQSGSALTVFCIESKTKKGIGEKNKNGYVSLYYPAGVSEQELKSLIIDEFARFSGLHKSKIELISGKKNKFLISLLGISTEKLNRLLEGL